MNMHCEITHLLSSSDYVLDTLVDRFHCGAFMCIWLQFNVADNNQSERCAGIMGVIISLFARVCLRVRRRTLWMGIMYGWRRAARESSVISERTPACWRPQWVVCTLTECNGKRECVIQASNRPHIHSGDITLTPGALSVLTTSLQSCIESV